MAVENDEMLNNKDFVFIKYTEVVEPRLVKKSGYGLIKKGYWSIKEKQVALKYITIEGTLNNILDLVKRTSPNIIRFLGVSRDLGGESYLLVFEYFEKNLRDHLSNKKLGWDAKIRISKDIANGIDFIHNEIRMVHQNLNTEVVFLDSDNAPKVFLSDPRIFTIASESSGYNSLDGSVAFVDPNVLKDPKKNYTFESDIYSLGVILWEISSEKVPFSNIESRSLLTEIINNNIHEKPIPNTPPKYTKLYQRCWLEPEKRPKISEIFDELKNILENKEFEVGESEHKEFKDLKDTNGKPEKESDVGEFEDTNWELDVSEHKESEDPKDAINNVIHAESPEINIQTSNESNDINNSVGAGEITSTKHKKTFCQKARRFLSNVRGFSGKLLICRSRKNYRR